MISMRRDLSRRSVVDSLTVYQSFPIEMCRSGFSKAFPASGFEKQKINMESRRGDLLQ